jgi:hypothetical protein
VDIERAHNYKQWRMFELQMAGLSWFVGLERTLTNKVLRVSFKYGWGTFCADNNLNVGNTCFFSVIHEATYNNDDAEEWEKELEDDEAKLMWRCARQTADGGGELGARVDTICILLFHQNYYPVYQDF